VDIIRKERGEHFAPDIVDVFLENINKIIKIKTEVDSIGNVSLADFAWSERDRAAYVQD
jgi:putative two-component system response regulator